MQCISESLVDSEARETGIATSFFPSFVQHTLLDVEIDTVIFFQRQDDGIRSRLVSDSFTPSVSNFIIILHQGYPVWLRNGWLVVAFIFGCWKTLSNWLEIGRGVGQAGESEEVSAWIEADKFASIARPAESDIGQSVVEKDSRDWFLALLRGADGAENDRFEIPMSSETQAHIAYRWLRNILAGLCSRVGWDGVAPREGNDQRQNEQLRKKPETTKVSNY